jgi:hypothetical protein
MISNFANNIIAATRLANNMIFANMEASRTTMKQTRDNAKELSRITVNAAKSLEQTAKDNTTTIDTHTSSSYFPSSTSSGFHSNREGYSFSEDVREE